MKSLKSVKIAIALMFRSITGNWFRFVFSHAFLVFTCLLILTSTCYASTYKVENAIIHIYATSRVPPQQSGAIIFASEKPIYPGGHPSCGNALYIDFSDKELFATALAASISNKPVSFFYEDAAPSKTATGHRTTSCKAFSIWY